MSLALCTLHLAACVCCMLMCQSHALCLVVTPCKTCGFSSGEDVFACCRIITACVEQSESGCVIGLHGIGWLEGGVELR